MLIVLYGGMTNRLWLSQWQHCPTIAIGFLLNLRYPTFQQKETMVIWGRDPSYPIYQTYRYAYDTYGYLLLAKEDTKTEEPAVVQDNPEQALEEGEPAVAKEVSKPLSYALEQLMDYDFLMKHFYNVHSSTTAGRQLMNAETFLSKDMSLEQDSTVPQILIYHTHSQETYADFGPNNKQANVVDTGAYLATLLREKGWNVLHDITTYDIKSGKLDRNKAYTYALDGITQILQKNPTIQVILDLHRDGVREGIHLVSEVNGKPTAAIMFFQGTSQTPDGPIEYLPNPYLEDNLAFTFQMQLGAEGSYPGLTRKIYMKGLRYNLHLRPRSALIEVGAQTNTGAEGKNAMEPLAELLDRVLQEN